MSSEKTFAKLAINVADLHLGHKSRKITVPPMHHAETMEGNQCFVDG